ncbi:hypothetical protein OF83DRAFT_138761 [Amylostereum chailletii]|nr:hypothetical protein OF83DRAFT_138761 [Amylostereum chailletii]
MPDPPSRNLQNASLDVNFNPNIHMQPLHYMPAPGMHPAMFNAPWPPVPPPYWPNAPFGHHVHPRATASNAYPEYEPPYVYTPQDGSDNLELPPVYNLPVEDGPLFPENNNFLPPAPTGATLSNISPSGSSSSSAARNPPATQTSYSPLASSSESPSSSAAPPAPPMASSPRSFSSSSASLSSSSPLLGWQPACWPNGDAIIFSDPFAQAEQPSAAGGSMDDIVSSRHVDDTIAGADNIHQNDQGQAASQALCLTTYTSAEAVQGEFNSPGSSSSGLVQQTEPGASSSHASNVDGSDREVRCFRHPCNGKLFNRPHDLLRHLRSGIHNKDPNAMRSHCRLCFARYARRDLVLRHLSYKDKDGIRQTGCHRLKFRREVTDLQWEIAEDRARRFALRFAEAGLREEQKDRRVVQMTKAMGAAARSELDRLCPLPLQLQQRKGAGGGIKKKKFVYPAVKLELD